MLEHQKDTRRFSWLVPDSRLRENDRACRRRLRVPQLGPGKESSTRLLLDRYIMPKRGRRDRTACKALGLAVADSALISGTVYDSPSTTRITPKSKPKRPNLTP